MPNNNIILMEEYNTIVTKYRVKDIILDNPRDCDYDSSKTLLWNLSSYNFRTSIDYKRFVGVINSAFTDAEEREIVEKIKNERKERCLKTKL